MSIALTALLALYNPEQLARDNDNDDDGANNNNADDRLERAEAELAWAMARIQELEARLAQYITGMRGQKPDELDGCFA
jgi:hypothetical protein